jgi:Domain of unknown function (DUF4407)
MDSLKDFFILCSGVDKNLLAHAKTDEIKHAGIGATIFFTGIFAFLASYYALYTVFFNVWASLFFGLFWGLMIFNLDRYIVSSMRKKDNVWRNLFMSLPRIALAVLISVVIAKPLELKIFESEIQAELITMKQETRKLQEDKLKSRFEGDIASVDSSIVGLKRELDKSKANFDLLTVAALNEADGTGGSKIRNMGPIYKAKNQAAAEAGNEFERLKSELSPQLATLDLRKNELLKKRDDELSKMESASMMGFASRIEAMDRISKNSYAIYIAGIFIMLLFIAIETSPIFIKLISERSPYDYVLDKLEVEYEMDHKETTFTTKNTVLNKIELERNITKHQTQQEIEAENELFTHAIKTEVGRIKDSSFALKDYLTKGRMMSKI